MDQISYFNKTVASKDMSGYYLLKNGEYAYNKSYSVGYDFGSVKRLDRYDMGALSTLYICFALKKHDSDFINAYFDSLKWYREIYMISAEGARNHGLLNVPTDEFFGTKHYIPQDLAEQRKIADFMIALEHRIEAQQSLVDNLKKYKRGVTEAIFTKDLRFTTKVLDCFTHTGAFALNAAAGGAAAVTAVDISAEAVQMTDANASKNGLDKVVKGLKANVFDLLSELVNNKSREYDFIILDPPAFTKSGSTVKNAIRGYKEINLKAMKLLPRGGYLATCSCSHFMKEELFVQMLHDAAADANVQLRQIEARQQSPDHPILWNVPETYYLKFYIFQVV